MLDQPMMDSISNPYKNQKEYDEARRRAENEARMKAEIKRNQQVSSYSGGYTPTNYYDELQKMQREILEKQRQQTINNIMGQTNSAIGNYQKQMDGLKDVYQPIKNQSEVERYRAKGILRENQANRGALDGGVGRQEQLDIGNNYGNRLNQINLQEQSERDTIQKDINDILAQRQLAIANAGAEFDIAGLQSQLGAKQQQYQDSARSYRNSASDIANKKTEDPYSYSDEEKYQYYKDEKSKKSKEKNNTIADNMADIMREILGVYV